MLTLENVSKSFGGIRALNKVNFSVAPHSITGLIGPNGSGKTTSFNIISGFYRKDSGRIFFADKEIHDLEPYQIAMQGIGRTFQISEAPEKMTVLENLLLAPKNQQGESILNIFFQPSRVKTENRKHLQNAYNILKLIQLYELRNEYSGNLSGGQKKLLSLGRILMSDPTLILLDEPTAGVNPTLIRELIAAVKKLRDAEGKTVLLIEHNMKVISEICDRVIVLDFGEKIAAGTPQEIQTNERVLEAYLSGSSKKV